MGHEPAKHSVHWLSSVPTPYNDYLFQTLADDPGIDLTVHYRDELSSAHPWQSRLGQGYRARYYWPILGVDWQVLLIAARDSRAFFVIAAWNHATAILLISLLATMRRRFALWTDTPDLHRKRNPVLAFLRSIWLRWVFRRAGQVMGTGRPGLEALRKMGVPLHKLLEFPFFLNLEQYHPSVPPKADEYHPMRFISSGRLQIDVKGHDLALRALASAARKTGRPFEYIIAGTGPDEARLRGLARELGLKHHVRLAGWVEPGALAELYKSSHVLIHPSPKHDPFPNSVLEGMAAGLAILGSDVSGSVRDRVKHGVHGMIHQAGDVRELTEHVEYVLRNPTIVEQMGRMSRESAAAWPVQKAIGAIKAMLSDTAAANAGQI